MWEAKERSWGLGDERICLLLRDCLSPPPASSSSSSQHMPAAHSPSKSALSLCSSWPNTGNDLAHIPLRETPHLPNINDSTPGSLSKLPVTFNCWFGFFFIILMFLSPLFEDLFDLLCLFSYSFLNACLFPHTTKSVESGNLNVASAVKLLVRHLSMSDLSFECQRSRS